MKATCEIKSAVKRNVDLFLIRERWGQLESHPLIRRIFGRRSSRKGRSLGMSVSSVTVRGWLLPRTVDEGARILGVLDPGTGL